MLLLLVETLNISTMSEKIKKEYTENIWTNNDGKIDGYTFKGKRQFSKALLGLKSIMIKGQANEIDNVKFTALDTRIQGVGLEIDVQIINNRKSGIAVLKTSIAEQGHTRVPSKIFPFVPTGL